MFAPVITHASLFLQVTVVASRILLRVPQVAPCIRVTFSFPEKSSAVAVCRFLLRGSPSLPSLDSAVTSKTAAAALALLRKLLNFKGTRRLFSLLQLLRLLGNATFLIVTD